MGAVELPGNRALLTDLLTNSTGQSGTTQHGAHGVSRICPKFWTVRDETALAGTGTTALENRQA